MENLLIMAAAVVALVAGGYGLGLICYERGYVHGHEDAKHPEGWTFTEEE